MCVGSGSMDEEGGKPNSVEGDEALKDVSSVEVATGLARRND
jgi:hypothetical protein